MTYKGLYIRALLISGLLAGCAAQQQPSGDQPPIPVASGAVQQQPSDRQPPTPVVSGAAQQQPSKDEPPIPMANVDQGLKLIEERDYCAGKAKLEEALRTQPTSSKAWFKLGRIYLDYYEDWNKAIECGERAVEYDPNKSDYHQFLGEAYARLAQRSGQNLKALQLARKAKSEFEKAFELNPKSLWARRALMEYLAQAPKIAGGNWEEAKRIAEETLSIHASAAYIMLASLCRGRGENEKAEENYLLAVEADPGNPWAQIDLGWFYLGQKEYEKARIHFQKYQELNPQDPHSFLTLGWLYLLSKKFAEAELQIKKAIDIQPRYVEAWYLLGTLYRRKGEEERAQSAFQKCTALDGDNRWTGAAAGRGAQRKKKGASKEEKSTTGTSRQYTVVGVVKSQQQKQENGEIRTVYVVEDARGILCSLPVEGKEADEYVGKKVKVTGKGVERTDQKGIRSITLRKISTFDEVE